LIPQPVKGPLGRGTPDFRVVHDLPRGVGQAVRQPPASQRLHNDNGQPLFGGFVQSCDACLGIFVQIVVLNLAEVPVVDIQKAAEHIGVSVVGKAHLPDLTGLLFLLQPGKDTQVAEPLPGLDIREHMHQVVVHVVRAQTAQLLLKIGLHAVRPLDQIVGQFGGDVYLVADAVPFQDLAQGGLAAGVDIGRVKIVDAAPVGFQ